MDVPIYFRTDSTAHLYPMSKGYHGGHPFDTYFPFMISGSVPQMETAHILHKTSSGSGWETGDSRIANVLFAFSGSSLLTPYRVKKIIGTELTQMPLAVFFPRFESLWGIEELSVIVSPGFIL